MLRLIRTIHGAHPAGNFQLCKNAFLYFCLSLGCVPRHNLQTYNPIRYSLDPKVIRKIIVKINFKELVVTINASLLLLPLLMPV